MGGGLKGQNFKRKVWGLSGNSRGGGGGVSPQKTLWVWIFPGTTHCKSVIDLQCWKQILT